MMLWKRRTTLAALNAGCQNTLVSHLGIVFTRLTDNTLEATMPVDERTHQPFGLLHGGASVVLAETVGSTAGWLCTEDEESAVGVEINASHLRSVRAGEVRGVCCALHAGRRHQVWQIEIFDSQRRLCCSARLTTSVLSSA